MGNMKTRGIAAGMRLRRTLSSQLLCKHEASNTITPSEGLRSLFVVLSLGLHDL